IENHCEIGMAFADGDLVDGNFLEVLELGSAKASLQISLLNVFDDVPTDIEVTGRVLDGGGLGQFQGIAFEGMRVGSTWVGEGNLHLAGVLTVEANHASHLEEDEGRLEADGHGLQKALLVSLGMNGRRTACGAGRNR